MITGTQILTGDAVVGVSGKPTRVFVVNLKSGGTAGNIVLRNGTTAAGTIYIDFTGTINVGTVYDLGEHGVLFPDGCFYDHDANNSHVSITYALERR